VQMIGIGKCPPYHGRRMAKIADENERPIVTLFSELGAGSWTWLVLFTVAHFFFPFRVGVSSTLSRCRSRASTCFDQKLRKGASQASSSMSGSGLS
jgi:hypothetical protein